MEDFYIIKKDSKENIVNSKGEYISDIWFDKVEVLPFNKSFKVKLNNKENFLTKKGKILFKDWYYKIGNNYCDLYYVVIGEDNKYNFIDKNGDLILEQYYKGVSYDVINDVFIVQNDENKFIILDKNNQNVFNEVFDSAELSIYDTFIKVGKNNKFNLIGENRNFIFEKWVDEIVWVNIDNEKFIFINEDNSYFFDIKTKKEKFLTNGKIERLSYYDGVLYQLTKEGKSNLINKNGDLIFDEWYSLFFFNKETKTYVVTTTKDKYNILKKDEEGRYKKILKTDCDLISYRHILKLFSILKNGKRNFVDTNGNIIFNEEYEVKALNVYEKIFSVKNNEGKYNIINLNNELLFDEWFDNEIKYHLL